MKRLIPVAGFCIIMSSLFIIENHQPSARAVASPAGIVSVPDGMGGQVPIQAFAANGKRAGVLGTASTFVNMTAITAWRVYTPNNCSFRRQSTATRAGALRTLPSGGYVEVVNPVTPFVTYTGCASGEIDFQDHHGAVAHGVW